MGRSLENAAARIQVRQIDGGRSLRDAGQAKAIGGIRKVKVLSEKNMLRVLVYLFLLVALALGLAWLMDHPGEIVLNWQGYRIKMSLMVGLGAILSAVAALVLAWNFLRSAIRSPAAMARASRVRRHEKGFAALSQGIHAVGIGDAQLAAKAAAQVQKYLPGEPL